MKVGYHVAKDTWFVYEWQKHNRNTINTDRLIKVYNVAERPEALYDIQPNGDIMLHYTRSIRILLTPTNCLTYIPTQISEQESAKMLKNICQMLENFTVHNARDIQ